MRTLTELTLATACDALHRGLGVAFPTPCGYGWAIDPFHQDAVNRVALLKPKRSQPVGLIAADLDQVKALAECFPNQVNWLSRWPAELSLILQAKDHLPELIRSAHGGVSVRIPEGSQERALASQFGAALTATSLNRSGEAPVSKRAHLEALPSGVIAGYLPGQAGTSAPSTLVDLLGPTAQILRRGSVDVADLLGV